MKFNLNYLKIVYVDNRNMNFMHIIFDVDTIVSTLILSLTKYERKRPCSFQTFN